MLKKILALLCSVLVLMSLAACGGTAQALPKLELPEDGEVSTAAVSGEGNLDSLCKYMADSLAVTGDPVEMSYKEIGAIGGVRYRFTYNGSTVQVELYEFDLQNLDAKGKECLDSVGEKGQFTILDKEVPAINSGKYLMIYTDASNKDENTAQRERAEKLFMEFGAAQEG